MPRPTPAELDYAVVALDLSSQATALLAQIDRSRLWCKDRSAYDALPTRLWWAMFNLEHLEAQLKVFVARRDRSAKTTMMRSNQ